MPKLPVVRGSRLIKALTKLGYKIARQKSSHVTLKKLTASGEHSITVPLSSELAIGTLNDILSSVSIRNNIAKEEIIKLI